MTKKKIYIFLIESYHELGEKKYCPQRSRIYETKKSSAKGGGV